MKRNLYMGGMTLAAAFLSLASCSDFSDYNEARADGNATGNQTLWENICANPDLSNFKSLVEKAGFADDLKGDHFYTVWAPTNAYLNLSDYQGMEASQLLEEFVENHVSDYNYTLSGETSERVRTLNKKSYLFTNAGTPTFDGIELVNSNIGSSNGVLHTIGGVMKYYPNAYTYLLSKSEGTDSLKAYFAKYEQSYLDVDNSVVGPIVDGKQTYVDSVIVTANTLNNALRARLDNEDSTYTFIMPTDKAWNDEYAKVKKLYNYRSTMPIKSYNTTTGNSSTASTAVNASYMADSLTRRSIVSNLIYSNNDYYNRWLLTSAADKVVDTLRTTRYKKIGNPETLLSHQVTRAELSNGQAIVVDTIDAHSWDTYSSELKYNATSNFIMSVDGTGGRKNFVIDTLGVTTSYNCLYIDPLAGALPTAMFYLPDVKSDTYQLYIAFAPGYDALKEVEDTLSNQFNVTLEYCNANGSLTTRIFTKGKPTTNVRDEYSTTPFTTKPGVQIENGRVVCDTVYIGQITFPVCYQDVNADNKGPILSVKAYVEDIFDDDMMAAYSRTYRIQSIILKPLELDNYEKSQSNE